jgi:hypothetical protein
MNGSVWIAERGLLNRPGLVQLKCTQMNRVKGATPLL